MAAVAPIDPEAPSLLAVDLVANAVVAAAVAAAVVGVDLAGKAIKPIKLREMALGSSS